MSKPLYFPDIKTWDELFPASSRWDRDDRKPPLAVYPDWCDPKHLPRSQRGQTCHIGRYCSVSPPECGPGSWPSISIDAVSDELRAFLDTVVLHCGNDTTHWSVHVYDDGTALVVLNHGVIIGSHWLARIDASTIPGGRDAHWGGSVDLTEVE